MNWPVKFGLSLHLHIFLGHVISFATADNRCNQFRPRSGILKKASIRQKNMKNYSNYSNKNVKKILAIRYWWDSNSQLRHSRAGVLLQALEKVYLTPELSGPTKVKD